MMGLSSDPTPEKKHEAVHAMSMFMSMASPDPAYMYMNDILRKIPITKNKIINFLNLKTNVVITNDFEKYYHLIV